MKRVLGWTLAVVVTLLVVGTSAMIYSLDHTEIKMMKQYGKITVDKNESVDYRVFMSPSGNYSALNQIDPNIRMEIADYMKKNNLKLTEGEHLFKRTSSTFEKLITEDFRFELIDSGNR